MEFEDFDKVRDIEKIDLNQLEFEDFEKVHDIEKIDEGKAVEGFEDVIYKWQALCHTPI